MQPGQKMLSELLKLTNSAASSVMKKDINQNACLENFGKSHGPGELTDDDSERRRHSENKFIVSSEDKAKQTLIRPQPQAESCKFDESIDILEVVKHMDKPSFDNAARHKNDKQKDIKSKLVEDSNELQGINNNINISGSSKSDTQSVCDCVDSKIVNCPQKDNVIDLSDKFDSSRSVRVKIASKLLREKKMDTSLRKISVGLLDSDTTTSGGNESETSRMESCKQGMDSVKAGVFVSSGIINSVEGKQIHSQDDIADTESQQVQMKDFEYFPITEVHKGLSQGQLRSGTSPLCTNKDNGVVAVRYPEGQKQKIIQEKFKMMHSSTGPVKRTINAKMIKYERGNVHPEVDRMNEDSKVIDGQNLAVASAAVATSAAIAPFIKIQDALEGQISSLVKTLEIAYDAKSRFTDEQKQKEPCLQTLKTNIVEEVDKRISKLKEAQKKAMEEQLAALTSVRDHTENVQSHRRLSDFVAIAEQPIRQLPYHKNSHSTYPDVTEYPARESTTDNYKFLQPEYVSNSISHQQHHLSYLKRHDTSSDRLRQLHIKIKDARTQTSPTVSSTMSEQSLLETPLPRSKIPVPYGRYTPKHEKKSSRRVKFSSDGKSPELSKKGSNLLREILKDISNTPEKEDIAPKTSSPITYYDRFIDNKADKHSPAHKSSFKSENVEILKDEMRDILKETKKLKIKLNQIHDEVDDDAFSKKTAIASVRPLNSRFAPLDTYLACPVEDGSRLPNSKDFITDSKVSTIAQNVTSHHFHTAERILQDVRQSRDRLENNLDSVLRNREDCRLYDLLKAQSVTDGGDLLRIRHDVDRRIQAMSVQIQNEVSKADEDQATSIKQSGNIARTRNTTSVVKGRGASKINKPTIKETIDTKTKVKQGKPAKAKPKKKILQEQKEEEVKSLFPLTAPSTLDYELLASIYGQPPYHPHRSSIRPAHIQFHSPHKTKEEPPHVIHVNAEVKRTRDFKHQQPQLCPPDDRQRYYFQPSIAHPELPLNVSLPSAGDLVPMAIPLGRPRQDSTLRLPIPSAVVPYDMPPEMEDKETSPMSEDSKPTKPDMKIITDGPNVAVITINTNEQTKNKNPIKNYRKKKKPQLRVQILPGIDIETSNEQLSVLSSQCETDILYTKIDEKDVSIQPPGKEEYNEFDHFLIVDDVESDNVVHDVNHQQEGERTERHDGFEFQGGFRADDPNYHGPSFPPKHSEMAQEQEPAILKSTKSIEEKAQEWVEQELLARIVSEMNQPAQDPTLKERPDVSLDSEVSSVSDAGDNWISNVLGLDGMQLFIDAGIPVNGELVSTLIRDVISERLDLLFGYPKEVIYPKEAILEPQLPEEPFPSLVSTPLATPIYTPPESETSALKTPSLSYLSNESTEELEFDETLAVQEKTEKTSEQVTVVEQNQFSTPIHTPPNEAVSLTIPMNVITPESSEESEHGREHSGRLISTPDLSDQEELSKEQENFIKTETEEEHESSEDELTKADLVVPASLPKPIAEVVQIKVMPSTPSVSFTISSTTTQGASTTGGISEGEHLCPDKIQFGQYSEGEFPLSPGQALLPVDELDDTMSVGKGGIRDFKTLLNGVLGKSWLSNDEKSTGKRNESQSNTLMDTEELQEDTLNEISLSEGELVPKSDPLLKLLRKIQSPPYQNEGLQNPSEGEISIGEKREIAEGNAQRQTTNVFRHRHLSSGEVRLDGQESKSYKYASLSVGEVRGFGKPMTDQPYSNSVFLSEKEDGNEITDDGRNSKGKSGHRLPKTIVVKPKTLDFDGDDSEGTLQFKSTELTKEMYDAEELPGEETSEKILHSTLADQSFHPTKIQLTIPSVASEDSADYVSDILEYNSLSHGEISLTSERDSF